MKTYHILTLAAIALLSFNCKDDDVRPLKVEGGGFTYDILNDCDIGSGANATEFAFQIELAKEPDLELGGVEFDLEWSDGDESKDIFEDDFIVDGTTVEFDWCFRFGGTSWFEVRCTILDPNDKPLSNAVTIRVNKPSGAN